MYNPPFMTKRFDPVGRSSEHGRIVNERNSL